MLCPTTRTARFYAADRSPNCRRGSISPKAIIAIVIFLAIMGALRYATLPGEEIQILEQQRVNATFLSGQPINLEKIRFQISMDSVAGTGIPTQMSTMAESALRAQNPDADDADDDGKRGDDSRVLQIQPDNNGQLLMVKMRLSRDYLEKRGKVKSLEANISMPDIALRRSDGNMSEPVYLASGQRGGTDTPKGKAAQFNFGSGNVLVLPEPAPQELWLAKGTVKQSQDLSKYVDLVCLFTRPQGTGELSYNIIGTEVPMPPIP